MNIYDISKKAGVSIATVSRVINGSDNVSAKTRERILKIMEESAYTPNAFARGLGRGTMETIGIMCSDASDIFLANAIHYLETSLRSHGYDSILCCTGYNLANRQQAFELLRSKKVDAIILIGSQFVELQPGNNEYLIQGAKEQPIMLVNGYLEGENIYSTLCDAVSGMAEAVSRLVEAGRRRIVYVYSSNSYSGMQKIEGVRLGFERCGLSPAEYRIVQCEKDYDEIAALLARLYEETPFDAVLTSSDNSGIATLKFAKRRGLRIPEDLFILSFDNTILARSGSHELSSIDSMVYSLCETTVDKLMKLLSPTTPEERAEVSQKTLIQPEIIERETTDFH